jgi:hypothetical protein
VLVNRDGEPPQMKTFMNYDAAQLDAMHLYHLDSGAVLTANMPYVGGRDQQLQKLGLDPAITVSAGITLSDGTPMTYYSDGTKSVFAMNPLAVSRRSYFSEAQYVNVKTIYFNNLQAISDYYKRTMTFVQVSGMVAEGVAGGGPLSTAATGAAAMRLGVRPKFGITASPPQQFVPNPGGRMGDAVTRAKTREVVEDLITRGFSRVRFEVEFKPGPFGSGKTRFADIVARNPVTGEAEIIQIGQTLRSNSRIPVMRERQALDDILFSPDLQKYPRNLIRFVDKNRPGVIQH